MQHEWQVWKKTWYPLQADLYRRKFNRTNKPSNAFLQSLEEIVQEEVEDVLAPVSAGRTDTRQRPTYTAAEKKIQQVQPPQCLYMENKQEQSRLIPLWKSRTCELLQREKSILSQLSSPPIDRSLSRSEDDFR